MRIAFKEWVIVVDALARGEQILILRKGGISEGRGGFKPEYAEFLLFPTAFHQQRESVIESAQRRFDEILPTLNGENEIRIEFFAEVIESRQLLSVEAAQALCGQHIWRDEVIAERFDWGRAKNIYAIALRVFRLANPTSLPLLPSYGGCKSWVELEQEIVAAKSEPVLGNDAFQKKLTHFRFALAQVAAMDS